MTVLEPVVMLFDVGLQDGVKVLNLVMVLMSNQLLGTVGLDLVLIWVSSCCVVHSLYCLGLLSCL